ncbi:hypothetical protein CsSME_00007891 [Camellia sinensis var. sinensis]
MRDFGVQGLRVKSRRVTLDLARSIGTLLHPSLNLNRLDSLFHCRVLARGRMLRTDLLVSSVASKVTRLVPAHGREEGSKCYHHHLTDLRVSPRVGALDLHGATLTQSVQQAYTLRDEQVDQRPQERVYAIATLEQLPGSSIVLINCRTNKKLLGHMKAFDRHCNMVLENYRRLGTARRKPTQLIKIGSLARCFSEEIL